MKIKNGFFLSEMGNEFVVIAIEKKRKKLSTECSALTQQERFYGNNSKRKKASRSSFPL